MSASIVTYRGMVYPWHCDHMGHMNVMWHTGKFDEACWQFLSMLGLTQARFAQDGTAMAALEQHIEYKRELHAGDAVTIKSTLLEIREKTLRMTHVMLDDSSGEVAARTTIVGVHLQAATRRAIALPADVVDRAMQMTQNCVMAAEVIGSRQIPISGRANGMV